MDRNDRPVLRRELRRAQFEAFMGKLAPTAVVLEARGSHHWGRVLVQQGHRVKLIPPQYVKPFVKRSKNDRNDAEAICEAASRPTMCSVLVKTVDEQAVAMLVKYRELLVSWRTQATNALRGRAAEFGIVAAKGCVNVAAVLAVVATDDAILEVAKATLQQMGQDIAEPDVKIEALDRQLLEQHKANPVSRLLAELPGVGPITAIAMALMANPTNFESGRYFAAWLDLKPKEHSMEGKRRLGRMSKAGNERPRQLLVVGAIAVVRYAKPGRDSATAWLLRLLERKPRKAAAVALANKMARIIWAMIAHGEVYRHQPKTA